MINNLTVLQNEFAGNTLQSYLIVAGGVVLGMLLLNIFKVVIFKRIKSLAGRTKTRIDDFILEVSEKTIIPLCYFGVFYFAVKQLALSQAVGKLLNALGVIVLTIQATRLVVALLAYFMQEIWLKREADRKSRSILTIIKIVVWGLGVVFMLDNLGFNVSAVVAGLGIGGIAVALAAQTILGDLFNYFVIFFDKPFKEGDFIIINEYLGVIEHIGIKTTRVRSLGGEQLVFSNSDLTSSRIRNYKRMEKRRVPFKLGVTYQTSHEQMKKIPQIIKGIIQKVDDTVFDRAHFQSYGDFSLNIEVVYYVLSSDYNKYMDIQEKINLGIKEAFEKEGIEFAYPTQTLYVEK